jgi:hypothetical protein
MDANPGKADALGRKGEGISVVLIRVIRGQNFFHESV